MTSLEASYKSAEFFNLVCDASFAYFHAKGETEHYEQNRFARASIISAALCIECFANVLMETLELPKRSFDELDRLPTLGKIDIYLKISGLSMLDRGRPEVQKIADLIRARNDFVHVKTTRVKSEVQRAKLESIDAPRWDFTIRPETHSSLGIYKLPFAWGPEDALKVLRAVSEFILVLVFRLDAIQIENVKKSLTSRIEIEEHSMPHLLESYRFEVERMAAVGVDFTMLLVGD